MIFIIQEQYAVLAQLAAGVTLSKHVEQHRGDIPEDAAAAAGRMADALVTRLSAMEFRVEQYEAVNRFAEDTNEKPGEGFFAFAVVVGRGPGFLILQVGGGRKQVLVRVGPALANADPLSRWLVLGVYSDQVMQVRSSADAEPQAMRLVMMYYMLKT